MGENWFLNQIGSTGAAWWHHTMLENLWGTPLNNPPIENNAHFSTFALVCWPLVTIFWIFCLHEWLDWRFKFHLKELFWCKSSETFEILAIEQRHHNFSRHTCLLTSSDYDIVPMTYMTLSYLFLYRFVMLKVQSVISIKTFNSHANLVPSGRWWISYITIFYRHYKGLHQMRKDLVLCGLKDTVSFR